MTASPPDDRDAAELRAFLAGRDVACPGCGYNLRGLTSAHCPECRLAIELRVGLTEPRLGMYLAAVAGLLGGASLAAIFLTTLVVIFVSHQDWPSGSDSIPLIWLPAAMVVVESVLLARALRVRSRVWFRRRSRAGRVAVVAGCWLLTAAFIAAFMVLLFRIW